MTLHKIDGEKCYTIDTAFEANADKEFKAVKAEKDGQSCTVTVELDGKAPGLPTGDTLNPSSARRLHARRPFTNNNITISSNVKSEDIEFELLRKAKHPDEEAGARERNAGNTFSASMETAREMGMFSDGHLVADNAVVVEPGVSFSIEALHASPHKFREFSTDKMGTGEGHQAFGWGLYFSGGRESNEHYYRQFASYRMRYGVDGAVEENERAGKTRYSGAGVACG